MKSKFPHSDMPLAELCERLHKQGETWFKNADLLLLEELIRRAQRAGANQGPENDRRPHSLSAAVVPDIPGVWPEPGYNIGRPLTQEEIAQIEAHGRDIIAGLLGTPEA